MNEADVESAIASNVMRLLDEWGLDGNQILHVLDLPSKVRLRHLDKFRKGDPFHKGEQTAVRIEHIAGIAEALRTTFPRNAYMGSRWLHTPHRRFQNKRPIELIVVDVDGLKQVRSELDCAYAWDQSGS